MSRTILLADDSLTIQKVVELTFQDTDYSVIAVSSGDKLLEQLPQCNPDIVICDVIMPGRDGYEICQEIKSNSNSLHLPVILLTGTFEPFDRDRALAVGCSEIITKPFEARKLVEAVERLATAPADDFQPGDGTDAGDAFEEGRVTPPPPLMVPEELAEEDGGADLVDTAVTGDKAQEAPEENSEGLDFTKSGFIEMEKAGLEKQEQRGEAPDEGLEFDLDGERDFPAEAAPASPPDEPAVEEDPFAEVAQPVSEPHPEATETAVEPEGEVFPNTPTPAEGTPVDDLFPVAEEISEVPPASDPDQGLTTPINVAEVMGGALEQEVESGSAEPESPETDMSDADTQDFGDETPAAVEASSEVAAETPTGLSDDDVDRIARRLLEIAGDRIDHIAWEIIPDMAEIVVRERLREIEAEAENS